MDVSRLRMAADGRWSNDAGVPDPPPASTNRRTYREQNAALARGEVEIREVRRRQLFVGGAPVGQAFD